MKRLLGIAALICGLMFTSQAYAQDDDIPVERLAQTGMKFLSVSLDARAGGMANAVTALESSAVGMFYNPASMARIQGKTSLSLNNVGWIANVDYNAAALAFNPAEGRFGVFGINVLSVNYPEFIGTIRADNDSGYEDTGTFSPNALSVGFGYAKAITDRFSIGATLKYVHQDLGSSILGFTESGAQDVASYDASTLAGDFGMMYNTGFESLVFAVSVRNFSKEITYAEEAFELPLTFQIGVSMDLFDLTSMSQGAHSFKLAINAERPRDFSEQVSVGGEYLFANTLALRAGYTYPTDESTINLGVGIQRNLGGINLGVDYAYTEFGVFGNVNRLGLHLGF